MAIQVRRGNYADLDTSRLVAGEPFTTLDQLPDGDYYVGMTIAPGTAVRLATWTNLQTVLQRCEDAADEAELSATNASVSEGNASDSEENAEAWAVGQKGGVDVPTTDPTYENNSKYYAEKSETLWNQMDSAIERVQPTMEVDFTTGRISYSGSFFEFDLSKTTGHLSYGLAV